MTNAAIILATKPFTGTPGPLAVAQWLAVREGRPLRLVCLLDPSEGGGEESGVVLPPRYVEEDRDWIAKRIDVALHQSPYARLETHVEVVDGSVPGTLERLAHEDNGSLLVMGSGRGGGLRGPLAQRVLRTARLPLLIVPSEASAHPLRRAIVAIDFTDTSARAAVHVLPLMASEGRLTLCHVRPRRQEMDRNAPSLPAYAAQCAGAFGRIVRSLPLAPGVSVDTIVLEGDVAATIAKLVVDRRADILVCGRRSPGASNARLLGSVSSRLVRQARIPVLVAPDVSHHEHAVPEWGAAGRRHDGLAIRPVG